MAHGKGDFEAIASRVREDIFSAMVNANDKGARFVTKDSLEKIWDEVRLNALCERTGTDEEVELKTTIEILRKDLLRTISILIWIHWDDWPRFNKVFFDTRRFPQSDRENRGMSRVDKNIKRCDFETLVQNDFLRSQMVAQEFLDCRQTFFPLQIKEGMVKICQPGRILPFQNGLQTTELGSGGYGIVMQRTIVPGRYKKDNMRSQDARPVAVKVLYEVKDFKREVKTLKQIRDRLSVHRHIASFLAVISIDTNFYILSEKADMDLQHFLDGRHSEFQLTPQALMKEFSWVADAVKWLHDGFLIDEQSENNGHSGPKICYHMDIKPENILVFKHKDHPHVGLWKLHDFGISKIKDIPYPKGVADSARSSNAALLNPLGDLKKRSNRTSNGAIRTHAQRAAGTWTAPEVQGFDGGVVGRESDVWSMGCIFVRLCELITNCYLEPDTDDCFYRGEGEDVALTPRVVKWARSLPEVKGGHAQQFLLNCRDVVFSTLQIAAKKRLSADKLSLVLDGLFQKSFKEITGCESPPVPASTSEFRSTRPLPNSIKKVDPKETTTELSTSLLSANSVIREVDSKQHLSPPTFVLNGQSSGPSLSNGYSVVPDDSADPASMSSEIGHRPELKGKSISRDDNLDSEAFHSDTYGLNGFQGVSEILASSHSPPASSSQKHSESSIDNTIPAAEFAHNPIPRIDVSMPGPSGNTNWPSSNTTGVKPTGTATTELERHVVTSAIATINDTGKLQRVGLWSPTRSQTDPAFDPIHGPMLGDFSSSLRIGSRQQRSVLRLHPSPRFSQSSGRSARTSLSTTPSSRFSSTGDVLTSTTFTLLQDNHRGITKTIISPDGKLVAFIAPKHIHVYPFSDDVIPGDPILAPSGWSWVSASIASVVSENITPYTYLYARGRHSDNQAVFKLFQIVCVDDDQRHIRAQPVEEISATSFQDGLLSSRGYLLCQGQDSLTIRHIYREIGLEPFQIGRPVKRSWFDPGGTQVFAWFTKDGDHYVRTWDLEVPNPTNYFDFHLPISENEIVGRSVKKVLSFPDSRAVLFWKDDDQVVVIRREHSGRPGIPSHPFKDPEAIAIGPNSDCIIHIKCKPAKLWLWWRIVTKINVRAIEFGVDGHLTLGPKRKGKLHFQPTKGSCMLASSPGGQSTHVFIAHCNGHVERISLD